MPDHRAAAGAFAQLRDRIAALKEGETVTVTAGHHDLGDGLWLSCDPDGQTEMGCQPAGAGFRLTIDEGGGSRWNCLGLRLAPDALAGGRYLGLLIGATPEALVSFTPTLRYRFGDGGMQDVAPPLPVLLPAGPREHLAHIPIDPDLAGRAVECELNLFFHTDRADIEITALEPLLMI